MSRNHQRKSNWEWEINSKTSWSIDGFRQFWSYRDLLISLVRKDFLSSYQQTILGPFWILVQPILSVITYAVVFKEVMGFGTDGKPALLFYLIGITLWNFFSELFSNTASIFITNIDIYNKVYFPRLIPQLAIFILNLIKLSIQLALLMVVVIFFWSAGALEINQWKLLICIPAIIIISGISIGAGLLFSMASVKYKDLFSLLQLILRLLMFICPVFYSYSMVPQKIKWLVKFNPLSMPFEMFRYAFLGEGDFSLSGVTYSVVFMLIVLFSGIAFFNKKHETLIDVA